MSTKISEITIANEVSPLGMDIKKPRIAWKFLSDENSIKQRAARIYAGTSRGGGDMWDSGRLDTDCSTGIIYDGKPLMPCTKYYVTVEAEMENVSTVKKETEFETGFLESKQWEDADWIGAPEYYVRSDALGVFSVESNITISENGTVGIVFGADDERLLDETSTKSC